MRGISMGSVPDGSVYVPVGGTPATYVLDYPIVISI